MKLFGRDYSIINGRYREDNKSEKVGEVEYTFDMVIVIFYHYTFKTTTIRCQNILSI